MSPKTLPASIVPWAYLFPNGWIDPFLLYPDQNCGKDSRYHSWRRMLSWIGVDEEFSDFINYLKMACSSKESITKTKTKEIERFLNYPRNGVFFYWFLKGSNLSLKDPALGDLVGKIHRDKFLRWEKEDSIDDLTLDVIRNWHQLPEFIDVMTYKGVPLGSGLEYKLMSDILANYFSAFAKEKQ